MAFKLSFILLEENASGLYKHNAFSIHFYIFAVAQCITQGNFMQVFGNGFALAPLPGSSREILLKYTPAHLIEPGYIRGSGE